MDDELIRRNPCRVKGADRYDVERPVLTVGEVYAVADAMGSRYRLLVLLAAFTGLRFGELASLRRRDVDMAKAVLMVRRSQAEMQTGALFDKAPKSDAGIRPVAFPSELLPDIQRHLDTYAGPGRDGHVFLGSGVGSCGGATSGTTGSGRGPRRALRRTCTSTISGTRGTPSPPRVRACGS
ncbi:hypothetical protein [Actinacidiphila glaucinigra]|uniref:hypothetical protein n=1 Tax=Actinacidiphila glaucinigra TaxID=235986 RepID=UPI003D8A3FDC